MRDIPAEAAYLREALKLCIRDVSDAVAWSDSVVAEQEQPAPAFFELSGMSKANVLEVLHVMEGLAANVGVTELLPRLLAEAHDKLKENPSYGPCFAKSLYAISLTMDSVPDPFKDILFFDDAYDLAAHGTYGSVEGVYEELLEFTSRFKP